MIRATSDECGKLLEGSYIVIKGLCKTLVACETSDFVLENSFPIRLDDPHGNEDLYQWVESLPKGIIAAVKPHVLLFVSRGWESGEWAYKALVSRWKGEGEYLERVGHCTMLATHYATQELDLQIGSGGA
jgi:hypothetical protein